MTGLVIFLCAVSLVVIGIGLLFTRMIKRKKGEKFALGWFTAWCMVPVLFDTTMVNVLLLNNHKWLWGVPALVVIITVLLYFLTKRNGLCSIVDYILSIFAGALIIVVVFLFCSAKLVIDSHPYHTIEKEYEVAIDDNSITINGDLNTITSTGVREVIQDRVLKMKEDSQNHYKGELHITYECMYPLLRNNHSECTCTEKMICEICKEYVRNITVTDE